MKTTVAYLSRRCPYRFRFNWWPLLLGCVMLDVSISSTTAGVLVDFETGEPNNDDYQGTFEDNPNFDAGVNLVGFTFDHVLAVQPSGGTTEYAFRRGGNFTAEPTDAITLELGFGVGDDFTSVSEFFGFSEFDFDTPVANAMAPTSSVFARVEHEPHRISFSNGLADGLVSGVAEFSIDVPDLDPSFNEFYSPDVLPENFPADAAAFTLRMRGGGRFGLEMASPFKEHYALVELGTVDGAFNCCGAYAGVAFRPDNPNKIIFGINAWSPRGELYEIDVARDDEGHITGFAGSARKIADAPFGGGGLQFGPDGVLFSTRWPRNPTPGETTRELGQFLPESRVADKLVDLDPFGVTSTVDALSFVPGGLPGEGQLKLFAFDGQWYTLETEPDDQDTFNVTAASSGPKLTGGSGISYVPHGSPLFETTPTVLVAEGDIFAYDVDANGDPIPETRSPFVIGVELLDGAIGSAIDPVTGDLLFTATPFFDDGEFFLVSGFAAPVPEPSSAVLLSIGFVSFAFRRSRKSIVSRPYLQNQSTLERCN